MSDVEDPLGGMGKRGNQAKRSLRRWLLVLFAVPSCLWIITLRDARIARAQPEPFSIGVWYFTLWNSTGASTQARAAKRLYGSLDSWGGVREYAEGRGRWPIYDSIGKPKDYRGREPLLGFYDLNRQSIVDAEIREAESEGISFFSFYYYVDGNGAEDPTSAPIANFFKSTDRGRLRFVLAPIFQKKMSIRDFEAVTAPKIASYIASGAYYTIGGRPLLIDFAMRFKSPEENVAAYRFLRREVLAKTGKRLLVWSVLGGSAGWSTVSYRRTVLGVDGFTCFAPALLVSTQYSSYIGTWIPWMKRLITAPDGAIDRSVAFAPCGSVGIDARPWYGVGWSGGEGPGSRAYTAGATAALFRKHLEQIKRFTLSYRTSPQNTILLYSWNEWGEGARQIEPSKINGYRYADIVREVFGLKKRGKGPVPQ